MVASRDPVRGEIWLVSFNPAVGAEIRKSRPALVISLDTVGRLPLRIVVPITAWDPQFGALPWFVKLPAIPATGLVKDSAADAFQAKSIALSRFVRFLGSVTPQQLDEVVAAVAMCIGAP
jgi:mRNA interferase MazF